MFLLASDKSDFEAASEPIRNILARNEAEVLLLKAWDERRLTYGIRGHKRGLYALGFFKADPSRIAEIEHDCRLNERFLRVLIIRRDRLSQAEVDAERNRTTRPPGGFEPEARAVEAEEHPAREAVPKADTHEASEHAVAGEDDRDRPDSSEESAQV
jgi:ribosomal protein S6